MFLAALVNGFSAHPWHCGDVASVPRVGPSPSKLVGRSVIVAALLNAPRYAGNRASSERLRSFP